LRSIFRVRLPNVPGIFEAASRDEGRVPLEFAGRLGHLRGGDDCITSGHARRLHASLGSNDRTEQFVDFD
jgi:hypothetical protein